MAITNPEAVTFANEKIRIAANKLRAAYVFAQQAKAEWIANDMASKLPDTAGLIVDGSATDGRHPITGADAHNIIAIVGAMITDYEANGSAKLNDILQVATNR